MNILTVIGLCYSWRSVYILLFHFSVLKALLTFKGMAMSKWTFHFKAGMGRFFLLLLLVQNILKNTKVFDLFICRFQEEAADEWLSGMLLIIC